MRAGDVSAVHAALNAASACEYFDIFLLLCIVCCVWLLYTPRLLLLCMRMNDASGVTIHILYCVISRRFFAAPSTGGFVVAEFVSKSIAHVTWMDGE